jgi:FtsH-binding integral membrane protein
MCVFALLGRPAGAIGAACAVVFGFVAANYEITKPSWTGGRLLPWRPAADTAKPWEWLPRAALVLTLAGLASRGFGLILLRTLPERRWWVANVFVWAPRAAAVLAVCGWLVPADAAAEHPWLRWALSAAVLLNWVVLDSVARTGPGELPATGIYDARHEPAGDWTGAGGQVAAYLAAVCFAAGGLLLYAHWASVTEVAVILGAALFGVAVAAGLGKVDASGAVPAGVVFPPVLLVAAKFSAVESVPIASLWLVALAPLALAPFLVPRLARHNGWKARAARAVLVLTPVVVALVLAGQAGTISYGGDDEWK